MRNVFQLVSLLTLVVATRSFDVQQQSTTSNRKWNSDAHSKPHRYANAHLVANGRLGKKYQYGKWGSFYGLSSKCQSHVILSMSGSFEGKLEELFPSDATNVLGALHAAIGSEQGRQTISEESLVIFKDLDPQDISQTLQSDFGMPPLRAHQCRTAITQYFQDKNLRIAASSGIATSSITSASEPTITPSQSSSSDRVLEEIKNPQGPADFAATQNRTDDAPASYKKVVLNDKAKVRSGNLTYGLSLKEIQRDHPILASELKEYYDFMTQPNTFAQEEPIRKATADVYIRHARLYLGWYRTVIHPPKPAAELSVYEVIPSKNRESATPMLQFLQWLRTTRKISVSYEANLLRGLIKLVKFRFCKESNMNDDTGVNSLHSFEDVPLVRELRKWHRDVGKRQAVAPRSSDESLKWITWPEYLKVVQHVKEELLELLMDANGAKVHAIAVAYQRYLILSIFAHVPDRQRTIRELQIGTNFVKKEGLWSIRHAPEDYKTGKCYGERPPMALGEDLTKSLDEYISAYRDALLDDSNSHSFLFAQPRTGKPLTQDSVYQIVVRACFKYTGKRTNPHLLRDMIVTHVRESGTATEQQLEALALYMGHSVAVQRSSYDRRTLSTKVAPAVELMNSINSGNGNL